MATLNNLDGGYGSIGSTHRVTGSSAKSKASNKGSFVTLMRRRGCWQRADAQSGGLLDLAMEEMGIVADDYDDAHASDDKRGEGPHIVSPLASLLMMPPGAHVAHVAHAASVPRRRLTRTEAVAIYLAQLGPAPKKAARRLAVEFGITAKAVRDVWTGKTWHATTRPVHAQQHFNNFLPWGAVSHPAVVAAARVTNALYPSPVCARSTCH